MTKEKTVQVNEQLLNVVSNGIVGITANLKEYLFNGNITGNVVVTVKID